MPGVRKASYSGQGNSKLSAQEQQWAIEFEQALIEEDQLVHGNTRYGGEHFRGHDHLNRQAEREFIAWDGEGLHVEDSSPQPYVLFGNSRGDRIVSSVDDSGGLSTVDCLNLLIFCKRIYPLSIMVVYSGNYDVNMILKDLPDWHLRRIYKTNKVTWNGYRIHWYPGKWLYVRNNETQQSVMLYDVFGFFQSSFLSACEKFLGEDDPAIGEIREGKQRRDSFDRSELETFIIPYWEREMSLLVRLVESLRDDLKTAGISISSWHGPGAIATKVFSINQIKTHMDRNIGRGVNRAAQYAYAGGRFEQFRCGHYPHTVWEYDINSAYPAAIAGLPSLSKGHWEYVTKYEPGTFSVWHIDFDGRDGVRQLYVEPQPLFCRHRGGHISYPSQVSGWYWDPEASLIDPEWILGGYVLRPKNNDRPFAFVQDMYDQRLEWKRQGISAEKALKLALNSMYGKMAQRIGGGVDDTGLPVIPTWHQLEWAGYVTSATRAKIYNAIALNPTSIIAAETDAVFSTTPLDLPLTDNLGDWKESKFDSITYLQSGFYFTESEGKISTKYRGLDKDRVTGEPKGLPYRQVLAHLSIGGRYGGSLPPLFGTTTRFNGLGISLNTSATWRAWETNRRKIDYGGSGKRTHIDRYWDEVAGKWSYPCPECVPVSRAGSSLSHGEYLHHCSLTRLDDHDSTPHSLPWEGGLEDERYQQLQDDDRWQAQSA